MFKAGKVIGLLAALTLAAACGSDGGGAGANGGARMGRVANYVRDKRIPLELCPSSNVQTGAVPSLELRGGHFRLPDQ